jgi:aminoglycoside N3'-acetyltransferase
MPLTKTDLVEELRALGLRKGMYLEVHSSLRSLGSVEGGARTVIDALEELITEEGAVIMPSFPISKPLELTEADRALGLVTKIRILDPKSGERTGMGLIADTFKTDPGVATGEELFRVSAWGREAEENAKGLGNLHARDGHALLIGVDIYRLTSMHYVESGMPREILDIFKPSAEALLAYPEGEWLIEAGAPPRKAWYVIQDEAFRRGMIAQRMIGEARCMFFRVNPVIRLYREALDADPLGLYGIRARA